MSRYVLFENFRHRCFTYTFRVCVCVCMKNRNFYLISTKKWKKFTPLKSKWGRKIPNTQFRVIIFLSTNTTLHWHYNNCTVTTTAAAVTTVEKKPPPSVQIFTKYDFSVLWDWVGMWQGKRWMYGWTEPLIAVVKHTDCFLV